MCVIRRNIPKVDLVSQPLRWETKIVSPFLDVLKEKPKNPRLFKSIKVSSYIALNNLINYSHYVFFFLHKVFFSLRSFFSLLVYKCRVKPNQILFNGSRSGSSSQACVVTIHEQFLGGEKGVRGGEQWRFINEKESQTRKAGGWLRGWRRFKGCDEGMRPKGTVIAMYVEKTANLTASFLLVLSYSPEQMVVGLRAEGSVFSDITIICKPSLTLVIPLRFVGYYIFAFC